MTGRRLVDPSSGLKSVLYIIIIFMLLGCVKDVSKDFLLVASSRGFEPLKVITDQLTGFMLPSDQRLPLGQLDSNHSHLPWSIHKGLHTPDVIVRLLAF